MTPGVPRLGRVTQVDPLRVKVNGDAADAAARLVGDVTGLAVDDEVLVVTVESRRFAWWVS